MEKPGSICLLPLKTDPLINNLLVIRNKKPWGYAFRPGLPGIQQPDVERVEKAFENVSS